MAVVLVVSAGHHCFYSVAHPLGRLSDLCNADIVWFHSNLEELRMIFIGDVHGKFGAYKTILKSCQDSIQVGDMGVGFRHTSGMREGGMMANPPYDYMVAGNHRFIRGNHDNPAVCRRHSQWIEDGHTENGMMFIGGGYSIDRAFRKEGYSWWSDEQLSEEDFLALREAYLILKPKVMVTHEPPAEVGEYLIRRLSIGMPLIINPSRTGRMLQHMWSGHSPQLWVFGHHHISFDQVIKATRFVCLAELEARDLTWKE